MILIVDCDSKSCHDSLSKIETSMIFRKVRLVPIHCHEQMEIIFVCIKIASVSMNFDLCLLLNAIFYQKKKKQSISSFYK